MTRASSNSLPTGSNLSGRADTYRKVFDRVADAIIIHAKDTHRILDANASTLRRYGYTLDELRRMTPHDLHPPEELDFVREQIDLRNVDAPNVYVHIGKDGRRYDVEILSDEVVYEQTPAWLSIVRDISDRKRAQTELARARDEALAASKHKSSFLSAMSHELRAPMNGVLGMATALLDTDLTEQQRDYAETIHSAGDAMLALLNELLDLSKIEAGRLELEADPFDLRISIDGVCRLLGPRVEEAGISLVLETDPKIPTCLVGDAGRIRQILMNLVGNAIKFTHRGRVTVRSECLELTDDACLLQISVEDTGIGIPADKLELIFEEYSQADPSVARQYGGTGLGLAISRRLVEHMGGRLQVRSREGHGSTFWFTLPLSRPQAALSGTEGSGPRVLIVHANGRRRGEIEQWLREWGIDVDSAGSGVEALQKLRENPGTRAPGGRPPIVIVDYYLPDMDGESVARAIRSCTSSRIEVLRIGPRGRGTPAASTRADEEGPLPPDFDADTLCRRLSALVAARTSEPVIDGSPR